MTTHFAEVNSVIEIKHPGNKRCIHFADATQVLEVRVPFDVRSDRKAVYQAALTAEMVPECPKCRKRWVLA